MGFLEWVIALLLWAFAIINFDFEARPTTDTGRKVVEFWTEVKKEVHCNWDSLVKPPEKRDPACMHR